MNSIGSLTTYLAADIIRSQTYKIDLMISSTPPSTGPLVRTFFSREVAPDGRTSASHRAIASGVENVSGCGREHGIVQSHLSILADLAEQRNVVFAFRLVNPLATQLLEQGYPTKDLNIKGKSADWGRMAGFIPVLQQLSKLAGDAEAIKASDLQIQKCIVERHDVSTRSVINEARLKSLCQEGVISKRGKIGQRSIELFSEKNGQHVAFQGKLFFINQVAHYEIWHKNEPVKVLAKTDPASRLTKPLTADYDLLLFAVPLASLDSRDNYNSPAINMRAPQKMLIKLFKEKSGLPGSVAHADSYKTGRPRPPILRIDPDAAESAPNRGIISPRLDAFIPAINTALGRSQTNGIVQHGADTENPYTVTADNYPCVVFMPSQVGDFKGVAMARNKDEAIDIFKEIKNSGFQFFGNREWSKEMHPSSYRRSSFNQSRAALELSLASPEDRRCVSR